MTSSSRPWPTPVEAVPDRPLAVGLLVILIGAIGLAATHSTIAALGLLAGVAIAAVVAPRAMLIAVIALFAIHPLAMRVAAVDLGIGGLQLVLLSAWKEVALGAILLVAIARSARSRPAGVAALIARGKPFDGLAIVLVVLVLGTLTAQHTVVALNATRLLLFPVGAYVAIRLGVLRPSGDLPILLVVATGVALFGIIQGWLFDWGFVATYWSVADQRIPFIFMAQYLEGPRSAGTLSSPVEFGTYVAIFLVVAVSAALVRVNLRRLALLSLPILIVALAMSFSRSAILAALIGTAIVVAVAWSRGRATARVVALIALVAFPALAVSGVVYANRGGLALIENTLITISGEAGPPPGRAQPTGSFSPEPAGDSSTIDHITSLQAGVKLVAAHPFGVGLGNVGSRAVPGSEERPAYFAESWYLTMGLSLGWLGLVWAIAWTGGLAGLAVSSIRRGDPSSVGLSLLGIVPTVALVGFLLPTMMEPQIAILPWALAGLAVQVGRTPPAERRSTIKP